MNRKESARKWCKGIGVEIGAFDNPMPGVNPIYIDKAREFAGKPVPHLDYIGSAYSLPVFSNSIDYIIASHVIEHCANPVKALIELYRVIKPGGFIYIVLPDKTKTFDRDRPSTEVRHMLEDYANGIDDSDPTHIHDFIYGIDWKEIYPESPKTGYEAQKSEHYNHYLDATSRGEPIDIHFHVFDSENTIELFERMKSTDSIDVDWSIEDYRNHFPSEDPNGILVVLKKKLRFSAISRISSIYQKLIFRNYPITKS